MTILVYCIEYFDKIKGLSGKEKKDLVMKVMNEYIDKKLDNTSANIIKGILSITIETIISASKGEFMINMKKKCMGIFKYK